MGRGATNRAFAPALVALALALTACGGGSDRTSTRLDAARHHATAKHAPTTSPSPGRSSGWRSLGLPPLQTFRFRVSQACEEPELDLPTDLVQVAPLVRDLPNVQGRVHRVEVEALHDTVRVLTQANRDLARARPPAAQRTRYRPFVRFVAAARDLFAAGASAVDDIAAGRYEQMPTLLTRLRHDQSLGASLQDSAVRFVSGPDLSSCATLLRELG